MIVRNAGPNFPVFESHAEVSCFHCEGDLVGDYWRTSGNVRGRGEYLQGCEKCGMTTYYDLRPTHFLIGGKAVVRAP